MKRTQIRLFASNINTDYLRLSLQFPLDLLKKEKKLQKMNSFFNFKARNYYSSRKMNVYDIEHPAALAACWKM